MTTVRLSLMLESSKIPKDSSLSRREIRRDKRRTRIRDAAFELFERQGFEATTIDQIAALADVGKGTFFAQPKFSGPPAFSRNRDARA